MRLLSVAFTNVRTLSGVRIEFGEVADAVMIAGGAASGKTSALEALVAGIGACTPGATPLAKSWLARGAETGAIDLEWSLSPVEREAARVSTSTVTTRCEIGQDGLASEIPLRLRETLEATPVEYFDAQRSLAAQSAVDPPQRADVRRARRTSGKYAWVREYLLTLARTEPELERAANHSSRFANALSEIAPSLVWRGIRAKEGVRAVQCVFSREDGSESLLEELSGSEQMAVLFAATLAAMPFRGGLILVDAPELHLPEGREDAFLYALTKVAPDAQFVVATTSADILRRAARGHIVTLGAPQPRAARPVEKAVNATPVALGSPAMRTVARMEEAPLSASKVDTPSYLLTPASQPAQRHDRGGARGDEGVETAFAPSPMVAPALPFVEGLAHQPPPASKTELAPDAGETIPFELATGMAGGPAIPFADERSSARSRPAKVDLSLFPIETFAAITAAMARGEERDAVLARHRLTRSLYEALSAAWSERLAKDPDLSRRFTELARSGRDGNKSG